MHIRDLAYTCAKKTGCERVRLVGSGLRYLLVAGSLLVFATIVAAAGPSNGESAKSAPPHSAGKHAGPSWSQLNADQREALAPLAGDWEKFDANRKRKWLDIAVRYKDLSPEGQQRMHERMPELAKLTPEERSRARENFKKVYALPPDQRRALVQQFQELPEERKQELAEQSKKKPGPPPRRQGAKNPPLKSGGAQPEAAAAHANSGDVGTSNTAAVHDTGTDGTTTH